MYEDFSKPIMGIRKENYVKVKPVKQQGKHTVLFFENIYFSYKV